MTKVPTLTTARNRVELMRDLLTLLDNSRTVAPFATHNLDCLLSGPRGSCSCGADELNNRLRVTLENLRKTL